MLSVTDTTDIYSATTDKTVTFFYYMGYGF